MYGLALRLQKGSFRLIGHSRPNTTENMSLTPAVQYRSNGPSTEALRKCNSANRWLQTAAWMTTDPVLPDSDGWHGNEKQPMGPR